MRADDRLAADFRGASLEEKLQGFRAGLAEAVEAAKAVGQSLDTTFRAIGHVSYEEVVALSPDALGLAVALEPTATGHVEGPDRGRRLKYPHGSPQACAGFLVSPASGSSSLQSIMHPAYSSPRAAGEALLFTFNSPVMYAT
ncbi:hypothetical protein ACLB9X_32380 [Streptomyces sp. 5K101]|uniref:hypothetical protein n=1 Tax=Streptomyces sp. 5K101 TaxID=3390037 RepID=UPI003976CB60